MTHVIDNSSSNTLDCNKENIQVVYAQNLVTATGNLSALHFVQREILEKLAAFIESFIPFLIESNRNIKKITDVSFVMSNNLKSSLTLTDTEYKIDYSKLLISQGNLPGRINARTRAAPCGIEYSWLKFNHTHDQKTDKTILVAYCEALNKCVYNIGSTRRRDLKAFLEIPQLSRYEVHSWLSFLSDDESLIATSVYTGAQIIP